MGLINKKRNVFSTIGSYNSMNQDGNMPELNDSFASVNNKKDVIPFLLEVLKVTAGTLVLKTALGELFTKVIDESEEEVKEEVINMFNTPEMDINVNETDLGNNGIDMPVKDIDNGDIKEITNTGADSLLCGGDVNNPNNQFSKAIIAEGTEVEIENLKVKYDSNTETFKIKPIVTIGASITVGALIANYINNTKLFDKNELLARTMDNIFGSITTTTNKTENDILKQLEVTKIMENLVAGDESLEVDQSELNGLFEKAKQLKDGVSVIKMGCCNVDIAMPLSGLTELVGSVSGSTDGFVVGNAITNTISQNIDVMGEVNNENIEANFIERIINSLTVKMLESVTTSPQIKMLMGISESVKNGGEVLLGETKDMIKKFKRLIICMKNRIVKIVAGYLFALALVYLIKLLTPIIKKIGKEKIEKFTSQIKGLVASKMPTTG